MLFSIKDVKSNTFGALFESENAQTAIREVVTVFMTSQNAFFTKFPSHFQLYKISEYDHHTGQIITHPPEFVIDLLKCKEMALEEIRRNMVSGENVYGDDAFTPSPAGDEAIQNV